MMFGVFFYLVSRALVLFWFLFLSLAPILLGYVLLVKGVLNGLRLLFRLTLFSSFYPWQAQSLFVADAIDFFFVF